jgi:hypothetical protein
MCVRWLVTRTLLSQGLTSRPRGEAKPIRRVAPQSQPTAELLLRLCGSMAKSKRHGRNRARTRQAAAGEAIIRLGTTITWSMAGTAATSGAAAASTAQAMNAWGNRSRRAQATGSVCTQSPIADSRVIRIRGGAAPCAAAGGGPRAVTVYLPLVWCRSAEST